MLIRYDPRWISRAKTAKLAKENAVEIVIALAACAP